MRDALGNSFEGRARRSVSEHDYMGVVKTKRTMCTSTRSEGTTKCANPTHIVSFDLISVCIVPIELAYLNMILRMDAVASFMNSNSDAGSLEQFALPKIF